MSNLKNTFCYESEIYLLPNDTNSSVIKIFEIKKII